MEHYLLDLMGWAFVVTKWQRAGNTIKQLNILLHSTLSNYGIFFFKYLYQDIFTEKDGMWIPVALLATWRLMFPISSYLSEIYENNEDYQRYIVEASMGFLFSGLIICSLVKNLVVHVIFYGIFCGCAISLVEAQIKNITYEQFQSKPRVFERLKQFSRAIGLFIMPHFVFHMAFLYGITNAQMIYSALLLNVIPSVLILTFKKKTDYRYSLNKYRTISGIINEANLIELSPREKYSNFNGKTQSDIFNFNTAFNFETEYEETPLDNLEDENDSGTERIKTPTGVEIMPKIEEESEPEEEYIRDNFKASLSKLRRISGNFEGIIARSEDGKRKGDILINVENIFNERGISRFRKSLKSFGVSSKKKCTFMTNLKIVFDIVMANAIKPFWCSLKSPYFAPAIMMKSTVNFMAMVYLVLVPHIALDYENKNSKGIAELEATFLLSLIAFSWSVFLIILTWFMSVAKLKLRITYIIGLLLSSFCYYLMSKFLSHEMVTLNCLLFGFCNGILTYTEEMVLRENFGVQHWPKAEGTVNFTSGLFVILFYTILYKLNLSIILWFSIFYYACLIIAGVSSVLPIFKFSFYYVKNFKERNALVTR